jgi:outer membrane protein
MKSMVLSLGLLLAALGAFAQTKVGIIDTQKALLNTAEIKKAQVDLETKYKPRQEQLNKIANELQDIQARLNAGAGKLTPEVEADLQTQGQRKQRDYQRLSEDLQQDVERDRTEILSRAGQRMQEVIKKLAEEKALDVVIDTSSTIYFKPALDLSGDATMAYDKAYPAS